MSGNDRIQGLGIFFKSNKFDGKDINYITSDNKTGSFAVYATKDKEAINFDLDDSFLTEDWYTSAIQNTGIDLCDPYVDGDKIVTTYFIPIMSGQEIIGVVGADIDISGISKVLASDPTNNKDDFVALCSNNGTIVAHSIDESLIMKNLVEANPAFKESVAAAQSGKESDLVAKSVVTGKESQTIFIPVDTEGTPEFWVFESVTSMDYFTKGARAEIITSSIISILIIVLIGVIITMLLLKFVSKPLSIMDSAISKFANYNLDVDEEVAKAKKYLNSKDEIGNTMRALWDLKVNLRSIVTSISNHAQNTAATAQELTATSQSTASSANEVASAVSNIAQGATSQAQDTQSAAQSVETSNGLLENMLEILENLKKATNNIDKLKNEGISTLEELKEISNENNEISKEVAQVIIDTNKSTEKITTASEMIQSISDQTNLLALNADIDIAVVM